jgi:hypothetical protein
MDTQLLFVAHGIDANFLRACDRSLETVLDVCRFITPTFMSIALIYSIGRAYLSGQGLQIDFSPIINALTLFLLLFFYQDLMNILGAGIKAVTQLFDTEDNIGEALQELTTPPGIAAAAQADNVAPADVVEQGGSWYSRIYNSITSFSIMNQITHFFTTTTVMLVRQIVLFIRQFVLGFLYVIGPIAICLSVIPAFSGLAGKWLQNFIAIQFWALTMNLLDLIYYNFADLNTPSPLGGLASLGASYNETQYLLTSVTFIILYCMVPTLTGYFIGSTAIQGFMSATVGMAAGAAATAAGVVFPAAAGGGATGALGRAMGFGKASSGSTGRAGGSHGSGHAVEASPGIAPAMAAAGSGTVPVRYNGRAAPAAPASGAFGPPGGAGRPGAASGASGPGASTLPSMGASDRMGNTVRSNTAPRKPRADADDAWAQFID